MLHSPHTKSFLQFLTLLGIVLSAIGYLNAPGEPLPEMQLLSNSRSQDSCLGAERCIYVYTAPW